jgi:hypothetical protein
MPILGSEVRVGANGTIYVAPSGTATPANIAAAWTGFTDIGYATEEGVTIGRALTTEQIKAWQSISAIRYLVTEVAFTISFSLLQWNETTLPFWLGGGTVVNQGAGSFKYTISSAPAIDERAFGVEWTDGGSITYRATIGRGMVIESGESSVTRSEGIALPITFAAMAPASGTELAAIITNDTAMS